MAGTRASRWWELNTNLLSGFNHLSSQISRSVGRWEKGASNLQPDVEVVQRLLEAAARALRAPELDPKGVDGKIARPPATSNTVTAIEAFQSRFTTSVDGLMGSAIGVDDKVLRVVTLVDSHAQGGADQRGVEKLAHGPTDDAPAKDIQNSDQV